MSTKGCALPTVFEATATTRLGCSILVLPESVGVDLYPDDMVEWLTSSGLFSAERAEVKTVAHDLLETLKREKLVIDWRKKQTSRALVRVAVEEQLDRLPCVFTPAMWQAKVEKVYQHIYDSYYGEGRSVYSTAAA